jgi:hypothetical protein
VEEVEGALIDHLRSIVLTEERERIVARDTAVTGAERARRRWRFPVTPSGLEKGPIVTGDRRETGVPTEGGDRGRPAVAPECNDCNEALEAARKSVTAALRLAMVADNAIVNGDVKRARVALSDLQDALRAVTAEASYRVLRR